MIEPIISFFDKLVDNFTWRRLVLILVVLTFAGVSAWAYEAYTQTFRLGRIERQIVLVEKLAALDGNKALVSQPDLQKSYAALQRQLLSTASNIPEEYELLPWAKKMLAAALAWTVFTMFLLLIPESYSTAKNAPGAILFGIISVAAPFVALAAAMPTLEPPWVNYTLYPVGHLVFIVVLMKLWQYKEQRKLLEKSAPLQAAQSLNTAHS